MKLLLASVAAKIIQSAVPLFPKRPQDCKVIAITTAAKVESGPKDWLEADLNAMRNAGFSPSFFDLDGATPEQTEAALADTDVIFISGGNTFFLLEKIRSSGFEAPLRKAMQRGAVYIGSSAGTIVCCPDVDLYNEENMDDPSVATLTDTKGMKLIDFFVMVHMDKYVFADTASKKLLDGKLGPQPVICLKDDQALFIDGSSISLI